MIINFPYPDVPSLEIEDQNLLGIFATPEREADVDLAALVTGALRFPFGADPLRRLGKARRKVLIVTDDVTRPTPVHRILPPVLEELHAAGVPETGIEFLLALGTHRAMTREEMIAKLGEKIVASYPVHNHDWEDPDACDFVGKTAQGVEIWINKKVVQADLVIGIGRIMPIEICGFTGGGKILVPGVCGAMTNNDMHWTRIDLPNDQIVGKADNPVRESIDTLARRAGLDFIVNVIMDIRQRVSYVVAGDLREAHRRGCELARELHCVQIPRLADIVVADSYPFDNEFWQANKALDTAGVVVRPGGVVILVTPCREGLSRVHREILDFGYRSLGEIKKLVNTHQITHKVVGVHMAQVSHVAREKATVILVTHGISPEDVAKVGLLSAPTPQAALRQSFSIVGSDASVAVLRGAAEMLPVIRGETD